jgi:glycosyltransferase involved in cell wall biosynthesis
VNQKPSVIFITTTPYPHGMAITNRLHLNAKGLQEAGACVKIFIFDTPESSASKPRNDQPCGVFDNVPFEYATGKTTYAPNFLVRKFERYSSIIKCIFRILNLNKGDFVFFFPYSLSTLLLIRFVTSIKRIYLICERTEHPYYHKPITGLKGILHILFVRFVYRLYDGIIVISEGIKDFLSKTTNAKVPIFVTPVLFNPDEFKPVGNSHVKDIIFTTGNLTEENGGILTLLSAFALISSDYPDLMFVVAGDNSHVNVKQKVYDVINEKHLVDRVNLVGYLSRKDYLEYLHVSRVNLLAKPHNFQSRYCFPSKIAEFLASGRPMIATGSSVTKRYLSDRVNVFFIDQDSVNEYASTIREVLDHPELSRDVGNQGRLCAFQNFDYKSNGRKLLCFLKSLNTHEKIG